MEPIRKRHTHEKNESVGKQHIIKPSDDVAKERDAASSSEKQKSSSIISWVVSLFLLCISYSTCPTNLQPQGKPTVQHVWYFGWISALSTGLGVLPLIFAPNMNSFWVGVSNGTYEIFF